MMLADVAVQWNPLLSIANPEIKGYTRACIVGARDNGDIGIVVYNNSWFYNTTSQEKSFTVTLTWLFVKNGLI